MPSYCLHFSILLMLIPFSSAQYFVSFEHSLNQNRKFEIFFVISTAAGTAQNQQTFMDFRASVNSIVDAMRNFISDIRVPERPNDADVDENESSDDEPNDYLT